MFAASAFGVTPASRRWSRSSVLNQFRVNFLFFAGLLLASASAAMIYTRIFGEGHLGVSIVHGLFIGGFVIAFERGLILRSLHRRIRSLPTIVYVLCAETAYAAVIAVGTALGGVACLMLGLSNESYQAPLLLEPNEMLYALAVAALFVFVIRMRDLLGAEPSIETSFRRMDVHCERLYFGSSQRRTGTTKSRSSVLIGRGAKRQAGAKRDLYGKICSLLRRRQNKRT